jgi:hypothetical protein
LSLNAVIVKTKIIAEEDGFFRCPKCGDEMFEQIEEAYFVFDDLFTDRKEKFIPILYCDWCCVDYVFIDDVPDCVKKNLVIR